MGDPLLKDVTRYSHKDKLTVRITRMWEHWSPDGTDLFGLNFVMVDRKGGTMEGSIPKRRLHIFDNKVHEGTIYRIGTFEIYRAREKYKTVDHPWRIFFAQRTVVEPVVPQPENFPKYGYTTYPISQFEKRIRLNILLSDVVGLVTTITGIFPPTGGSNEQRRLVHITDGETRAIVTLWGKFADTLDADRLQRWSSDEPVVILFVGMSVDEFSGTLAFKSTLATRWYINPTIPETTTILERATTSSYQIEVRNNAQNRREAADTTIVALSALEPTEIMNQYYKLRIKITEVVSTDDWWYMGCKQCWKKLRKEQGIYICPTCTQAKPFPRYRISLHGVYANINEEANPTFAEFTFFGQQGNIIIGKDIDYLLAETRGRNEDTPHEISDLVGKNFIVTVTPSSKTLDNDYCHFQVQATEHVANTELLAPLPLSNDAHPGSAGQSSSSALLLTDAAQSDLVATPPPTDLASQKNGNSAKRKRGFVY